MKKETRRLLQRIFLDGLQCDIRDDWEDGLDQLRLEKKYKEDAINISYV